MSFETGPYFFKGIEVDVGGIKVVVPPMPLGAMELLAKFAGDDEGAKQPNTSEAMGAMVDAITMTLKRNYPQITRAEVAELFDMDMCVQIIRQLRAPSDGSGDDKPGELSGGSSTDG